MDKDGVLYESKNTDRLEQFLLVRPWPSLRITFTSPALRIPGLVQTRLLDRIGGTNQIRESITNAFAEGVGITAKVAWLTHVNGYGNIDGRPRWLHATPMYGSDEKIGVWMVVMIEDETITGSLQSSIPSRTASFTRSHFTKSPGPPPAVDANRYPGPPRFRNRDGSVSGDLYAAHLRSDRVHENATQQAARTRKWAAHLEEARLGLLAEKSEQSRSTKGTEDESGRKSSSTFRSGRKIF